MSFADRRAEPGAVISSQTALGESVRLTADDDGIVHIRNADQQEVADYLQLGTARAPKPAADGPTHRELVARAKALGLSQKGSKAVLEERIATAEKTQGDEPATNEEG